MHLKQLSILFAGTLLIAACKKKEDPAPATPDPGPPAPPSFTIESAPVFYAEIDGTPAQFSDGANGIENLTAWSAWANPTSYRSFFFNNSEDEIKAEITLGGLSYSGSAPTDQEFFDFFTPGSKPFISTTNSEGVEISLPAGGMISASGFGVQPAESDFTITDVIPYDDGSGIPKVKVRATFNCKLYGTSTRTITNGTFVGVFAKE